MSSAMSPDNRKIKSTKKRIKKPQKERVVEETLVPPEARFLLSAAYFHELPEPQGDEFCILGRSNVGKSSFVNHVLGNTTLARVSKKPGKTSLANYYQITPSMVWVDLPGYGYAKASRSEKKRWSQLIADYCEKRENLVGAIWLVDIRHVGIQADLEALQWLLEIGIPFFPVLTKGDKLPQSKRAAQAKNIATRLGLPSNPLVYSTQKHSTRNQFWKKFTEWHEQKILPNQ